MAQARERRCRIFWGALTVVVLAAAGVVAGLGGSAFGARADSIYTDSTGDGGNAPDITRVVVSQTKSGQISFHVEMAGTTMLPRGVTVYVGIDADRNPATGSPEKLGADYLLAAQAGNLALWVQRWNGIAFEPWQQATTGSLAEGDGATISIDTSSLGGTTGFNFWVSTQLGTGGAGNVDFAPNAGTWTYTLTAGPTTSSTAASTTSSTPTTTPKAVKLQGMRLVPRPNVPAAGARFSLLIPTVHWSNGKSEKPDSVACTAKLAGAPFKGTGTGGCTFDLPRAAAGKMLMVKVTAGCRGQSVSTTAAFEVRAASTVVTKPKPKPTPQPTPTTAPSSAGTELGCKLAGPRFYGHDAGKAAVCFTLAGSGKTIVEYAYDPCAAAKVALSAGRYAKPVPVKGDGSFTSTTSTLAAGEVGIGFVNITFSGRIQGAAASGTLTLTAPDNSSFRCLWSARRASAS